MRSVDPTDRSNHVYLQPERNGLNFSHTRLSKRCDPSFILSLTTTVNTSCTEICWYLYLQEQKFRIKMSTPWNPNLSTSWSGFYCVQKLSDPERKEPKNHTVLKCEIDILPTRPYWNPCHSVTSVCLYPNLGESVFTKRYSKEGDRYR